MPSTFVCFSFLIPNGVCACSTPAVQNLWDALHIFNDQFSSVLNRTVITQGLCPDDLGLEGLWPTDVVRLPRSPRRQSKYFLLITVNGEGLTS